MESKKDLLHRLDKSWELISSEDRWVTDAYYEIKDCVPCYCSTGAINRVRDGDPEADDCSDPLLILLYESLTSSEKKTIESYFLDGQVTDVKQPGYIAMRYIQEFNDRGVYEDVKDLWTRARKRLENGI